MCPILYCRHLWSLGLVAAVGPWWWFAEKMVSHRTDGIGTSVVSSCPAEPPMSFKTGEFGDREEMMEKGL